MTNSHASNDSTVKMKYRAQNKKRVQITYLADGIMDTGTHSMEVSQLSNRKQEN